MTKTSTSFISHLLQNTCQLFVYFKESNNLDPINYFRQNHTCLAMSHLRGVLLLLFISVVHLNADEGSARILLAKQV